MALFNLIVVKKLVS